MTGFAELIWVDLECADPAVLAEFYHQVLGWEVTDSQDDYALVSAVGTGGSGGMRILGAGLARLGRAQAVPPGPAGGRRGQGG
jgi:predicted enzyme related to lactoylglutathione lyase